MKRKYDFVLPYSEEETITDSSERAAYYTKLRENFRKMSNPVLSIGAFFRKFSYPPIKFFLEHFGPVFFGYKLNVKMAADEPTLPDGPKIFISSHQHFSDALHVLNAIPGPIVIMCSSDVPWWVKIIFRLSGVLFTDRKSKNSTFNSKNRTMEYLAKGYNLVIFSEATYCASPSKYLLSLYPGAFDASMKMDAFVIPMVQEYDVKLDAKKPNKVKGCTVEFLHSFKVPLIIDRREFYSFVEDVRDRMASVRHHLIEDKYLPNSDNSSIKNDKIVEFSLEELIKECENSVSNTPNYYINFEKSKILIRTIVLYRTFTLEKEQIEKRLIGLDELLNSGKLQSDTYDSLKRNNNSRLEKINSRLKQLEERVNAIKKCISIDTITSELFKNGTSYSKFEKELEERVLKGMVETITEELIRSNIDSIELTEEEARELAQIINEKYKMSEIREVCLSACEKCISDIKTSQDLFLYASSRTTDMQALTLSYRMFVASQFATFNDMGVTCTEDETPSIHTKYYSNFGDADPDKSVRYMSPTFPPINFVAWNPDTYELLDCGIKSVYFKSDLERELNSLFDRNLDGYGVNVCLSGSKLNICCTQLCSTLNTECDVERAILAILSDKFPGVIEHYKCSVSFNDTSKSQDLSNSDSNHDREALEILVIPDRDYSISHPKFHSEESTEEVLDFGDEVTIGMLKELRDVGIIDNSEYKNIYLLCSSKVYRTNFYKLIDYAYEKGKISSRLRNKILSYVYYKKNEDAVKENYGEHNEGEFSLSGYDKLKDPAYMAPSTVSEKIRSKRRT